MEIDEQIQVILEKLNGSEGANLDEKIPEWLDTDPNPQPGVLMSKTDTVTLRLIKDELWERGLIKDKYDLTETNYEALQVITIKGRRILQRGGWPKYVKAEHARQELELVQMQSVVKTNHNSQITMWLTVLLSLVTAILSFNSNLITRQGYELQRKQIQNDSTKHANIQVPKFR